MLSANNRFNTGPSCPSIFSIVDLLILKLHCLAIGRILVRTGKRAGF